METKTTDELAQILWDFNNFHQHLEKADGIFLLGNFDIRTAQYAAKLFIEQYAPLLIISGNRSVSNLNLWNKPEAQVFADESIRLGVPEDKIVLEEKATNTGENILFTKKLIEEKHIHLNKIIVVHKPFMLRRTFATFMKQWPDKEIIMTAPPLTFSEYPNEILPKDYIINVMVGDTQRVKEYAEKGFQIPQDIPSEVWAAYQELIKRGYTKHVVKE